MFSLSVDCKHFKDNSFNMINYKGYNTIPCSPTIEDGGKTIVGRNNLDPNKVVISCDELKTTLNNDSRVSVCNSDTDKNKLKVAKEGFQHYYTDEDFFS
jgi:hypothetical protein